MSAPLLELLRQPSCIPLLKQTVKLLDTWLAANKKKLSLTALLNKDAKGVPFKDYAAKKLIQQNNVSQLSTRELLELYYAFLVPPTHHLSLRIIVCRVLSDHDDRQPGDTIVTPEGAWQIHDDLQAHAVLNQKEMEKFVPADLRYHAGNELRIIKANDNIIKDEDDENDKKAKNLTEYLNSALRTKPNSRYIAQHNSGIVRQMNQVLAVLRQEYVEKEIYKRQPLQHIFNIFGLKSSYQLIQYAKSIHDQFDALQRQKAKKQQEYGTDDLAIYITNRLSSDIGIQDLSDEELQILHLETYSFMLPLSTRLILIDSVDKLNKSDRKNGDTYVTSDGMWQQDASGIMQPILNKFQLRRVIKEQMPDPNDPLQIIHPNMADLKQKTLIKTLNQAISDQPNVLYLGSEMGEENNQSTTIVAAMNTIAKEEMVRRNLLTPLHVGGIQASSSLYNPFQHLSLPKNFFGLFRSNPSHNARPSSVKEPQRSIKQLQNSVKRLQHVQQDLKDTIVPSSDIVLVHTEHHLDEPRTLEDVQESIDRVIDELALSFSTPCQPKQSKDRQTVQVLQNTQVIMEASPKTLAVYKPLLQADMDVHQKAELFLQALGIPPTHGKEKIEVKGGDRHLRKAIREKFKHLKENEPILPDCNHTSFKSKHRS